MSFIRASLVGVCIGLLLGRCESLAADRPELFLQTGHSSMILSVAYSPDGRYLATAGADRSARLWDTDSGLEVRRFFGHEQMVMAVAFSPDGKLLATGSLDKTARLWDVATGKQLRSIDCRSLNVTGVVFSPDGRQLLTACYADEPDYVKGTARLWDVATGKLLQTFSGHDSYVTSVAFSPDGRRILTGSQDTTARLWDAKSGQELKRFEGHAGPVRSVAFTADGKLVATGADDKTARQWDPNTGREVRKFTAPGLLTVAVLVFPDGRHAGTSPVDGSAQLWDIESGKKQVEVRGHRGIVSCGCFSPDGQRIATGSLDATARIWNAAGKELRRLESRCSELTAAVYSPDGKSILTAGRDGVARLFDAATGRVMGQLTGHTGPITAAAFSHDGARIITAAGGYMAKDHTARVWDAQTGKELHCLVGHTDGINAAAFSPDGRYALTGSDDKMAWLWDAATGKRLRRLEGHEQKVTAVAFSSDGKQLLTGGWDCTMRLWNINDSKEVKRFETAPDVALVQAAAFSPDGRQVLAGCFDLSARLFDVSTGEQLRKFQIEHDLAAVVITGTSCVAFSPDGRRILISAEDHTVRVFDASTGMEMRRLTGHTGIVNSAMFSPDGSKILTAGEDGSTRVWDAASGRELAWLIGLRRGGEWVAVTPEGYFDASLEGRRLVMWRVGGELFPLESYEKKFHRPDLVAKALRGEPLEGVPTLPLDRTPPRVSLTLQESAPESATVKVTAHPGSKAAGIASIRITVDGRDLAPKRSAEIIRKRIAEGRVGFWITVDFPPGKQKALVAAMVTDDFGLQSDPVELLVVRPVEAAPAETNLYVLTVGISRYQTPQLNLGFCHADAEALAAAFERQQGQTYSKVHTRVYTNEEATVANVAAGLKWLEQSCKPADVAVVLFAGHGMIGPGGLYYLTHETELNDLEHTALNWSDVARRMKHIVARQVLFFSDCCHAGAFGPQAVTQDQLAEPLVKEAGVMVFASSRGNEKSAERPEWGHGAFVRALLDGLDGRADLIADGQINISELQTYVVDRVRTLTDNAQHPYIPRLERFDPGLVLAQASR